MKNSAVLASLLFGAFAVAAPFDKRALVTATSVVTETVIVYTTVYDDEPAATSSAQGLFYEQPATTSSAVVVPTSSSTSSEVPSSIYTPPVVTPTPTPTPVAPSTSEQPVVVSSSAAAPVASSAAVASGGSTTGQTYSNIDITVYDTNGGYGACGTELHDTDMIVALAKGTWGASTYDVQTGASTNPWCGQKIQIEYEGNSIQATIMDLCPGCLGSTDIDLSNAAWKALTGKDEKTRLKASWSKIA